MYSEFFWSVFFRIRTDSVRMSKNIEQKSSKYGHFSRSDVSKDCFHYLLLVPLFQNEKLPNNKTGSTWNFLVPFCRAFVVSLHKKWSFPLRISSVNVTKSAGNFVQCFTFKKYWVFKSMHDFSILAKFKILGTRLYCNFSNAKIKINV